MMKDTDPLTVVRGYLDAYTSNDISAAATYLADDFDFEGPFVHATSAKEFIGDGTGPGLAAWAQNLTGMHLTAAFAKDDEVIAIYDVHTRPFGTIRTASHFKVADGKIQTEKIIFDPTPIHQAKAQTAESSHDEPQAAGNPIAGFDRALAAVGELVAGVGVGQWTAPTPCTAWTVCDLVNHLVTGHLSFTALLGGTPPPERDSDHLGDDPAAAYSDAGAALAAAFAAPGILERVFQSPIGPAPGAALLQLRIAEQLVHGWDLAQATGQKAGLPADLAETQLGIWQAQLAGDARDALPFRPAQPVDDDAPAIDRLVAFLGRPIPASGKGPVR